MNLALITLSDQGAQIVNRLSKAFAGAQMYAHEKIGAPVPKALRFSSIMDLTREIFHRHKGLIFVAPCGLVVRSVAPNIRDKYTDPAVVVVDVGARYAISLLGGHEGGANDLALSVSNILGAEPVITTSTEAVKSIIVGVGCRRGTRAEEIIKAIGQALDQAGVGLDEVRLLASCDIKADEEGLLQASRDLNIPLRFIRSEEINLTTRIFEGSDLVQQKVNVPAVAEPAALLAGRRTTLILPKTVFNKVTIAVSREGFMW